MNTMAITNAGTDAGSMNYAHQDVALALALQKLRNSLMITGLATNYSQEARDQGSRYAGSVQIPEVGTHTVQNKVAQTKINPTQVALTKHSIDIDQHKVVDFIVENAASLVVGNSKQVLSRTFEGAVIDLADAVEAHVFSKYVDAGTIIDTSVVGKDLLRLAKKYVTTQKFQVAFPTYGLWGAEAEYDFLNVDAWTKVNESGTNEALRNAQLGKIFGINNFVHNNVPVIAGSPNKEVELIFQSAGLGVAFVDMSSADLPAQFQENGALASVLTLEDDNGLAIYSMRMVSQYDMDYMGTRIQIDTQFGADVVRAPLVIAIRKSY